MRISTAEMYQHNIVSMNLQQSIINGLQSKISSGKRITVGSDDPVGVTKASNLRHELNRLDRFVKNAGSAQYPLQYEDTVLAGVSNIYQRINELTIYAGDASLSRFDLETIANEVEENLKALYDLSNTRDANGDYIFSGFKVDIPAVALSVKNEFLFQGDEGQKSILVGDAISVLISDSGKEIFFDVQTDRLIGEATATISTGTGVISQPVVIGLSAYPSTQTYSIVFGGGGATFSVFANSQPPTPLEGFDNVTYVPGQAIEFEGISLIITGVPNAGDTFEIALESVGTQDVFSAIQKIISAIRDGSQTSEKLSYQLGQGLTDIKYAQNNMLNTRTEIGARLNIIDNQSYFNENLKVFTETNLSAIEDLDYAEAISQLTLNSFILQAGQQSFVKIQSLGLFGFM